MSSNFIYNSKFFSSSVETINSKNSNLNKLNPNWVTGFTDAEGCFSILYTKNKNNRFGWQAKPAFQIELHNKDLALLHQIKQFFQVGIIHTRNNRNLSIYQVTSIKDIVNVIVPHFVNYPLLTQKSADFQLFKEAIELMDKRAHWTLEGFNHIISLKSKMNNGLSETLQIAFPHIKDVERPIISPISTLNPFWVLGFCDGESSFGINISQSKLYISGFRIQLRFRITQHNKDLLLLQNFINFFNCGQVEQYNSKNATDYIVSNSKSISINIIPFFQQYSLLSSKLLDFQDFYDAADAKHRAPEARLQPRLN
jgi:hypothetical protein